MIGGLKREYFLCVCFFLVKSQISLELLFVVAKSGVWRTVDFFNAIIILGSFGELLKVLRETSHLILFHQE